MAPNRKKLAWGRFAQVSTRHPEGGLNRVPLPDLPPPPARGRTRTLRQNYFGSPGSLFCRQMVSLSKSLTSLGRASITSVLGSAREAGLTTFSFTSTSCLISPSTATSCAALPQPRLSNAFAAITRDLAWVGGRHVPLVCRPRNWIAFHPCHA